MVRPLCPNSPRRARGVHGERTPGRGARRGSGSLRFRPVRPRGSPAAGGGFVRLNSRPLLYHEEIVISRRNGPKAPFTLVNLSRRNELRIAAFEHAPAYPLDGVDDRRRLDVIERLQQNR